MEFVDLATQRERLGDGLNAAILQVLDHGQFIMGPEVFCLEGELSAYCGAHHCVSCGSGTDALLLALMAWGVGPGDAIFVPTLTFAATAEAVALLGATPVFVDVDPASFTISPESLVNAIDDTLKMANLSAVGVIPVDLFGHPAAYPTIMKIANEAGCWVLADAAQSFGARVGEQRSGSMADMTATSFFPAKPLGCYGDGGAVFTQDDGVAGVLRSLRVHGQGTSKYHNVRVGFNARLDTIQAAILLQKLTVFDDELVRRKRLAGTYSSALSEYVEVPSVANGYESAWAQYTIKCSNRNEVAAQLRDAGIPTGVYYPVPLHEQPAYRDFPASPSGLACAEKLVHEVLSLPMHPYLTKEDQEQVISAVQASAKGTS